MVGVVYLVPVYFKLDFSLILVSCYTNLPDSVRILYLTAHSHQTQQCARLLLATKTTPHTQS